MANKERRRTRISSKIEQLPPHIKSEVDSMIADTANSYQYISDWLRQQKYDISRGAVGRYAIRINEAASRMAESLEKTKLILEQIERNPDIDIAKAAQAVMADGLMQRMSTADGEFFELPLEKAGRLLASFRRVDVAERKLLFEQRSKIDLAFAEMESQIMQAIGQDAALAAQLRGILAKAKERVTDNES